MVPVLLPMGTSKGQCGAFALHIFNFYIVFNSFLYSINIKISPFLFFLCIYKPSISITCILDQILCFHDHYSDFPIPIPNLLSDLTDIWVLKISWVSDR